MINDLLDLLSENPTTAAVALGGAAMVTFSALYCCTSRKSAFVAQPPAPGSSTLDTHDERHAPSKEVTKPDLKLTDLMSDSDLVEAKKHLKKVQ